MSTCFLSVVIAFSRLSIAESAPADMSMSSKLNFYPINLLMSSLFAATLSVRHCDLLQFGCTNSSRVLSVGDIYANEYFDYSSLNEEVTAVTFAISTT
jgi:hypothetical protein